MCERMVVNAFFAMGRSLERKPRAADVFTTCRLGRCRARRRGDDATRAIAHYHRLLFRESASQAISSVDCVCSMMSFQHIRGILGARVALLRPAVLVCAQSVATVERGEM